MFKRLLCILAALVSIITLTSCWDHVEISEMLVVAGIGLDYDDSTGKYSATVEFVNVEAEGDKNITAEIVEGEGDTAYNAIGDAMLTAGGIMFGNHCKAIVIGDTLARKGVSEVVEMILRNPDFRKTVDIMIAEKHTAKEIFAKKTVNNDIISYELAKILRDSEKAMKNTVSTDTYDLHDSLAEGYSFDVLPAVSARKNRDDDVLIVDGCAVLSDMKLQGFLNGEQCKLYNLLMRGGNGMLMTIDEGFDSPVDIKLSKSKVDFKPAIQSDELIMRIYISANASTEDAVGLGNSLSTAETRAALDKKISERLALDVHAFISEVQSEYASDIFDFHLEYRDAHRLMWPELRENWSGRFRDIQVAVYSDVRVTDSGLIKNYMPENGDGANALP